MDQPTWLTSVIDAFVEEKYDDCIEILTDQPELDFTCSQLLLISLVRRGRRDLAISILNTMLFAYPAQSLEARLLLYSVGSEPLDLDQELSSAGSDVDLCRIHFYSGQMMRTFAPHEQVILNALTEAAQTRADCIEQTIAERIVGARGREEEYPWLQKMGELVKLGDSMVNRGKVGEGVAQYREALALALDHPEAPKPVIGMLHHRVGVILANYNLYSQARPHLEAALPILRRDAERRRETAHTLSKLGICQQRAQEYETALATFTQARELWIALDGEEGQESLTALDNIAYTVELMGDLERAQELLETVVRLRVKVLGPGHASTLESYTALASLLERRGDLQHALRYREREVAQRTETFGLLEDYTFQAYGDWLLLLLKLDSRDEARTHVQKIVAAAEGAPKAKVREAVYGLIGIANKCYERGEVTFNVECVTAAVELARGIFRPADTEMIDLKGTLAESYRSAGRLEEALLLNEECLEQRRRTLGPVHENVALSLNNLAQVHQDLGHFSQALELMEEALRIDRTVYGESHHAVAGDLNNIGLAYNGLRDYARARDYYHQAVNIWQTLHPEGEHYLGVALGNLGRVYLSLGDMVGAQRYLVKAYGMLKRMSGTHHPETLSVRAALATLDHKAHPKNESKEAQETILAAIDQIERQLGSAHPDGLALRAMLAQLDNEAASRFLDDALSSMEENSLRSPRAAILLDLKARRLAITGDFEGAEAVWRRALKSIESTQWYTAIFATNLFCNLARAQAVQGKFDAALEDMRRAVESFDVEWNNVALTLTETDREGLLYHVSVIIGYVFNLLVDHMPDSTAAAELALECSLRYKGLETSLLERERASLHRDPRPEVKKKFDEVRRLKERINDELMVNPGARGTLHNVEQIKAWQLDYRRAGEELARLLGRAEPYGDMRDQRGKIASRLPPDAGLLEIVQFENRDLQDWSRKSYDLFSRFLRPPRYVAFLLRPAHSGKISWAFLGSVNDVLGPTLDLLHYVLEQPSPQKNSSSHSQRRSDPGSWNEAALFLRQRVLDPIEGVWDCHQLFVAPDGILTNVPLELLPDPEGDTLLERRRIVYVASGRDLLKSGNRRCSEQTESIVVADPAYDLLDEGRPVSLATLEAFGLALSSTSGDRHLSYYPRLNGTVEEGEAVAQKLRARLWVGAAANRSNLMSVRSPRVLHLATHGFSPDAPGIDAAVERAHDSSDFTQMTQVLMQPGEMNKSGLVLAGANWKATLARRFVDEALPLLKEGEVERINSELSAIDDPMAAQLFQYKLMQELTLPLIERIIEVSKLEFSAESVTSTLRLFMPPLEAGGGLLTAEDAAWLDLSATDLVTLSACGTGLGINSFGGGLLGLRRAFLVAGARTLVCSLWKIPDQQTAGLMRDFYDFALSGDDCDVALSKARLKMQRAYPNRPYYWAAFVCYGNPGPLSPAAPVPEGGHQ